MEPISIEEYKKLHDAKKKIKKVTEKAAKLTAHEAMIAMAVYFEIDQKSAKFFIRQLELSGKI